MKIYQYKKYISIVLFLVCVTGMAHGAEDDISSRIRAEHPPEEKPYEFPQWAKDLRRADIIAFGVFPFVWFLSTIIIDVQRVVEHNGDQSYYTGIFTQLFNSSTDLHEWGSAEYKKSFAISGILCVTIALTDYLIVRTKRSRAEKKARARQASDPDIKRTPLRGVPLSAIESVSPLVPPAPEGN
jgi:hypothetical protein